MGLYNLGPQAMIKHNPKVRPRTRIRTTPKNQIYPFCWYKVSNIEQKGNVIYLNFSH